jgi:hypothetical protein
MSKNVEFRTASRLIAHEPPLQPDVWPQGIDGARYFGGERVPHGAGTFRVRQHRGNGDRRQARSLSSGIALMARSASSRAGSRSASGRNGLIAPTAA